MATAILRPHDCLRPQPFYDPFSTPTPKPFPNRRRSRPVRSNQSTPSPPPKHGRPNPNPNNKSNRKSSSPSPSPSTSPRSTSPSPSTSPPLQDGFRLLKRGESLPATQPGSGKASPVRSKDQKHKQEVSPTKTLPFLRRSEPPPTTTARVEKTPPRKQQAQSDRAKPQLTTPPAKPIRVGSDTETIFAGPNFAVCAPEACCLPQPMYLLRSGSAGPASEDEASRTLRTLLKLQCL